MINAGPSFMSSHQTYIFILKLYEELTTVLYHLYIYHLQPVCFKNFSGSKHKCKIYSLQSNTLRFPLLVEVPTFKLFIQHEHKLSSYIQTFEDPVTAQFSHFLLHICCPCDNIKAYNISIVLLQNQVNISIATFSFCSNFVLCPYSFSFVYVTTVSTHLKDGTFQYIQSDSSFPVHTAVLDFLSIIVH